MATNMLKNLLIYCLQNLAPKTNFLDPPPESKPCAYNVGLSHFPHKSSTIDVDTLNEDKA